MGNSKISAVLFDLDGVLVNFDSDWKEAEANVRKLAKKCNIEVREERISRVFGEIWGRLSHRRDREEFLRMEREFEGGLVRAGKVAPYPAAKDLLRAVKLKRMKTALVSNNLHETAAIVLENSGMREYFDQIICFDDVIKPKPDPEGINEALRRLKVKPEEALFVGDGKSTDLEAAQAAGVEAIIFERGKIGENKEKILGRI